jgi:hypothetical protein
MKRSTIFQDEIIKCLYSTDYVFFKKYFSI